jgi:lysozyme
MTKLNARGYALLKHFEGCRLEAYRCQGGFWTIGFGHTASAQPGMTITRRRAEQLLRHDVQRFENAVDAYVDVRLNENQFAALVCFTFNVGIAALEGSTLLRLLNRGWYEQVPAQLLRWNKVAGIESRGLTRRREAEAELWKTLPTKEEDDESTD